MADGSDFGHLSRHRRHPFVQIQKNFPLMRQIPKTELSPDNGCVIDTKWKLGPLQLSRQRGRQSGRTSQAKTPSVCRSSIIYDHVGFKGAYARTNLSFHYLGDFWNDRISSHHHRQRRLAFLSRRILQGRSLGPRAGILRMLFHGKRPGRRHQLVSGIELTDRSRAAALQRTLLRQHRAQPPRRNPTKG